MPALHDFRQTYEPVKSCDDLTTSAQNYKHQSHIIYERHQLNEKYTKVVKTLRDFNITQVLKNLPHASMTLGQTKRHRSFSHLAQLYLSIISYS